MKPKKQMLTLFVWFLIISVVFQRCPSKDDYFVRMSYALWWKFHTWGACWHRSWWQMWCNLL